MILQLMVTLGVPVVRVGRLLTAESKYSKGGRHPYCSQVFSVLQAVG